MSTANLSPKIFSLFGKKTPKSSDINETQEKKPRSFDSTPSIIAKNLSMEGQIFSSGLIEIEGSIKGIIKGKSVILLEGGTIEGEVIAESFSVRGKFLGTIKSQNVNIGNKAEVVGTIEYATLSVEDGASVDAKFKKIGSES